MTLAAGFSERLGGHPGFSYDINDTKAEFWSDALFHRRTFVFEKELKDFQVFPIAVSPQNYSSGGNALKRWLWRCRTKIQSYCFLRFDGYSPVEIADLFYYGFYGEWLGNEKWKIHLKEWRQLGHLFLPFLEWSRFLNVRKFERKPRQDAFLKDEAYFGKLYVMWLCHKWGMRYDYEQIMPDPCKNPRVPPNAIKDSCKRYGCFANEVSYACRGGMTWSRRKFLCEPDTYPCSSKQWRWYCVRRTTARCLVDPSQSLRPICICKPKWGKSNCASRLNACNASRSDITPPGDYACGVHLGNDCLPRGFSNYSCKCRGRWTSDSALPYPNCKAPVPPDPCRKLSCQNGGSCQPVPDRPHLARCVCAATHFGTLCDVAFSAWAAWKAWQPCEPPCGAVRRQLRWRTCSGSTPCAGPMVERRQCDAVVCPPGQEAQAPRDKAPSDRWRIALGGRIALLLVKVMCAELGISTALAALRFLWRWWWARKMAQLLPSAAPEAPQVEPKKGEQEAANWMPQPEEEIK